MSHLIIKTIKAHLTSASLHVPRPGHNPWLQRDALGPAVHWSADHLDTVGESWDAERDS